MKHVEVVCALIQNDKNEIFICRRGTGSLAGKWEFPGGKIENGESKEEAIIREVKEELSSDIEVISYLGSTYYEYKELDNPFSIFIYAYLAKLLKGKLTLSEHTDSKYINIDDYMNWDFAEADYKLIEKIKNNIK